MSTSKSCENVSVVANDLRKCLQFAHAEQQGTSQLIARMLQSHLTYNDRVVCHHLPAQKHWSCYTSLAKLCLRSGLGLFGLLHLF